MDGFVEIRQCALQILVVSADNGAVVVGFGTIRLETDGFVIIRQCALQVVVVSADDERL